MSEIERLIWQIEAKTEGLRRELKKAEQSGEKFTRKMDQTVARTNKRFDELGRSLGVSFVPSVQAASAAVVAAAAAMGVASIIAASDVEEMQSKFNVVFGDSADQVRGWSKDIAEDINRSSYDIQGFASTIQDTFVPLGFARSEAAEMSKTVSQLAFDLASFNNTTDDQAINDLQSALVGNHETMRKYGVIITQATLDQELLNQGFKGGAKDATEQQKALARLNIIMAGTSDAQGDAANTAGSFANQWRGLQAAVKDLSVAFGDDLLPAANRVVSVLTDITRAIEDNYENSELFRYVLTGPIGYLASQVDDIEDLYEDLADVSERIRDLEVEAGKVPDELLKGSRLEGHINELLAKQLELRKQISEIGTDKVGPDGSVDDVSKPVIEDSQNKPKAVEKKYTSTKDGLQFQLDQLARTNREQEVYNALRQAGAKADTEAGKAIADLAGKIYDITQSRKELNEAIKKEDEQNEAVKDVEQEIANIEREVQALLQGKEAYEAYQQAREIEQGSEAIRERLEALGLEEEQINRLIEAYERHSEELDKAEETFKKREEAVERQKQSERELADILENGIGRSLSAAADGWDALGKVALDVLGQILAESLKLEDVLSSSGGSGGGGAGLLGGLLGGIGSGLAKLIPGFADGGRIRGPGGPRSDSLLAKVSNNEFIVNAAATSKNLPLLEAINSGSLPAFADGGFVGGSVPRVPDISKSMQTINNSNRSSSNSSVVYNIDARGAEVGVEQKIKQALDEREPVIIEGAVQQVREESYRSGSSYLGGG